MKYIVSIDLSKPGTNSNFFVKDSLSERRSNPFQIDTGEVRHIEKSGKQNLILQ